MPAKIVAFQCSHCKKLIASNTRYVRVETLSTTHEAAPEDNDWKKSNNQPIKLDDAAFCDQNCFGEFIFENLKFKA